jgi:hypothetical protein
VSAMETTLSKLLSAVMHTSAEIQIAEFIKTEVSDDAIQAYFKQVWLPFWKRRPSQRVLYMEDRAGTQSETQRFDPDYDTDSDSDSLGLE